MTTPTLTESRAHETGGSDAAVRKAVGPFAHADNRRSALQLVTSFGPFLAGCVAMHLAAQVSRLLVLALAVPTGALLVRVFIVQHDCGHGSFFASKRANALVGRMCSLITITPFANWSRQHGLHHADWNNLDRNGGSDIYSACLTVDEYLALSRWGLLRTTKSDRPLR
jgi:omega-6 fatty acid desaturase (delta-12 desaturase)